MLSARSRGLEPGRSWGGENSKKHQQECPFTTPGLFQANFRAFFYHGESTAVSIARRARPETYQWREMQTPVLSFLYLDSGFEKPTNLCFVSMRERGVGRDLGMLNGAS